MDFFEVIHTRQSIRAFQDRPVDPEKLQQILEAINRAPSAGNLRILWARLGRVRAGGTRTSERKKPVRKPKTETSSS